MFFKRFFMSQSPKQSIFLRATSVKLVHGLNNNFYLRGFSISCSFRRSLPSESGHIFLIFYFLRRELLGLSYCVFQKFSFSGVRQFIEEQLLLKSFQIVCFYFLFWDYKCQKYRQKIYAFKLLLRNFAYISYKIHFRTYFVFDATNNLLSQQPWCCYTAFNFFWYNQTMYLIFNVSFVLNRFFTMFFWMFVCTFGRLVISFLTFQHKVHYWCVISLEKWAHRTSATFFKFLFTANLDTINTYWPSKLEG
jgi:hypothetical protein